MKWDLQIKDQTRPPQIKQNEIDLNVTFSQ